MCRGIRFVWVAVILVIEPNVRFFTANKARGIFMQAAGNAWSAEFSDLRNYMMANLVWDPNRSGRRLMDEFLSLHYGEAAPPIRRYIAMIHDAAEASGVHRHCFAGRAREYGIDDALAQPALDLFAEARRLAGTDEVRRRVDKASIAAYRFALDPVWEVTDPATVEPEPLNILRPLIERFLELCDQFGVDRVSEGTPLDAVRPRLRALVEFGV